MSGVKKKIAYFWRRVKRIKQRHLVLFLIILLAVTLIGLRQNNLEMIDLRNKVVQADEALSWEQVDSAATNLQEYVSKHMNADTGQIALQHLYDADVEKAFATANTDIDSDAYQLSAENCQSLIAQSGYQGYATCVADSVGVNNEQIITPDLPNSALYYISFVSPKLSFDIPGVCLVLMIVVFFIFLLRAITGVVFRIMARKKVKI